MPSKTMRPTELNPDGTYTISKGESGWTQRIVRVTPAQMRLMLVCMSGLFDLDMICHECAHSALCFRIMQSIEKFIEGDSDDPKRGRPKKVHTEEFKAEGVIERKARTKAQIVEPRRADDAEVRDECYPAFTTTSLTVVVQEEPLFDPDESLPDLRPLSKVCGVWKEAENQARSQAREKLVL